jgi:uncharacterized protein (TIGR00730 family)
MLNSICVYCGSSDQIHPVYYQAAKKAGFLLAKCGIRLVYGAGKTGLMGSIADSVLANGGKVTGVVPENLNQPQLIHSGLTDIEVVADIQTRKRRMLDLADGLIALPGGFGTYDELFEALTWAQIGLHTKPIGVLNTEGYFDPMIVLIDHAAEEGFIYPEHKQLLLSSTDPQILLEAMKNYTPPEKLARWVKRDSIPVLGE